MLSSFLKEVEHGCNPLHIYCRLVKIGCSKEKSLVLCRFYERTLHFFISGIIRILYKIYKKNRLSKINQPLYKQRL